jgi:diguanylate cyclase (GGDEF)-like protein
MIPGASKVEARKEAIQAGKGMAGRPWRLSARLLIACSALTMVGFSAICGNVMLDMRRGDVALARQSLDNLASGIDADIGRNIELYDNSLRAVASSMVLPEIKDVSRPIRHLILFGHAATARYFGAIQVFDRNGQLTNDASTLDPAPESRVDEEYFAAHRDRSDTGLFISRPMLHRGAYAIVLSRRITGADGSFLGVVAGSIRFSYFHDLFGRLNVGSDDMISVLRRDGTIIMRTPFDLDVIGKNLGQVPAVVHALSEANGSYSGPGEFDSVPRLLVWRDNLQPLVVLVGKPWDRILSVWRGEAIRIGAIIAALVAFALAATLVLAREIRRRGEAEDKLEELATTDALTGLRNRRKFDAAIDGEWRRAARHRTPVSLLMIDADHFKAYNDTFGHQAGDQVLVGIAICISDSIKRAGDCAARYGGEEFAVLLPGLSATEALAVAETIRRKVEGWSDDATLSTVSIGIASTIPAAGLDWPQFVHAADRALYAAKAAGRNRCVLAAMPALALAA